MMNPREIPRWLLIGFLFGTGWAAAKAVWSVLAGLMAIVLPVLLAAALGWAVFSRLRPAEARRHWQRGAAWLKAVSLRGRGAVRAQVFRRH